MELDSYVDSCTFNVLSLCSGVGGLELGFKLAVPTARTICFVEREAYCCEVLVKRMEDGCLDEAPIWTDLRTFDGKPWCGIVDCITGGYPCQPFSIAGKHAGDKDERHLWPDVARVVREICPKWCFFENVSNHLRLGFEQVHDDLSEMGYKVAAGLFAAKEVGSTQGRERLLIVANRKSNDRGQYGQPNSSEGGIIGNTVRKGSWGLQTRIISDIVNVPTFPYGPSDLQAWQRTLGIRPELAPTVANIRGMANGVAFRVDRLRACGNGVVPRVAAFAWLTLTQALLN